MTSSVPPPVRWGLLGAARIARKQFLPALRSLAGGQAYAIAGRDPARTRQFAHEEGIPIVADRYEDLLSLDAVQAVYIALPSALHAEWTLRALAAGKAVLTEKPVCLTLAEAEMLVAAVKEYGALLWECFAFLWHDQTTRARQVLASGHLGQVREIQSNFHVPRADRNDIRFSLPLGGGALNDLGCYCIRLADLYLDRPAVSGLTCSRIGPTGVDDEARGILTFPGPAYLQFSCGLLRPYDPFTRIIGTGGQIAFTNPFHPRAADRTFVLTHGGVQTHAWGEHQPSYRPMLAHLHAALGGLEEPRWLAADSIRATARALDLLRASTILSVPLPDSHD